MDALSDVLRTTRLTGGVFLHAEFSDPWCLNVHVTPGDCAPFLRDASEVIPYHYVLDGRLRVRIDDESLLEVGPDQVLLFPRNDPHLLGGDLNLPPVSGEDVVKPPSGGGLYTIRLGGDGPRTRIVCGFLGGEQMRGNPVIGTLPAVLSLDVARDRSAEWIRSTFRYAADEITAGRMGSETVMAKLSELLFVDAIRRYAETLPDDQTGWLAGLRDPYVSRALAHLHATPHRPWTVETLGSRVGLSRSALGDHFTRIIGMPPMQYLANWRMQLAAQELRRSSKSIAQVAAQVGYDSEAAFSRAFKRVMGTPPGVWRRRRR